MSIYTELNNNSTFWPEKGSAAIITAPGFKQKVIDLIETMDFDEFKRYGVDEDDNFIIPIMEDLKELDTNRHFEDYVMTHPYSYYTNSVEYYGKFDLNLEEFYHRCEQYGIPVLVIAIQPGRIRPYV